MTYKRQISDIGWKPVKSRPAKISPTGKSSTRHRSSNRRKPSTLLDTKLYISSTGSNSSDYNRPLREENPTANAATSAKLATECRSQNKPLPGWLLDQRLASRGITLERHPDGRLAPLSAATKRQCCLVDPNFYSATFSRNFLRFSEPIPWGTQRDWGERYTGIDFDSPYQLDREFDWPLIAHAEPSDLSPVPNIEELPFWGKMNSGIGFVAFGDFDNPFFAFCPARSAAWKAAQIAAIPIRTADRLRLLQLSFKYLPRNAPASDWVISAQPAFPYSTMLAAALPLSPGTSHHVTRARILHLSGIDFGGDVTLNIPLMVLCDALPLDAVMMCLTLRQYKEYTHVWKRLPEFPTFNRSWGDIVHHSDAPEYTRARTVISHLTAPVTDDWTYSADAPDSSDYR